jgi:hypothetical protein
MSYATVPLDLLFGKNVMTTDEKPVWAQDYGWTCPPGYEWVKCPRCEYEYSGLEPRPKRDHVIGPVCRTCQGKSVRSAFHDSDDVDSEGGEI